MNDAADARTADWGERTGGALVDLTIAFALFVAGIVLGSIAISAGDWGVAVGVLLIVAGTLAATLYAPLMLSRQGAANGITIGKRAAGLRVLRNDKRPIGFWLGVLREFVLPILIGILLTGGLFWLVDALWPLFDDQDRAIHDIVCETRVVKLQP